MNASQTTFNNSNNTPQAHPIFNGKFEILKSLGEGNTSKVYLGRLIGGND